MDPITLLMCFAISFCIVNPDVRGAIVDGAKAVGRGTRDVVGGAIEGGRRARRQPGPRGTGRYDTTGGGGATGGVTGGGGAWTSGPDTYTAPRHRRTPGGGHVLTSRQPGVYPDGGTTTAVIDPAVTPDIDPYHPLHYDTTQRLTRARRRGYRVGYGTVVRGRRARQWVRGARRGGHDARHVPDVDPDTTPDTTPGTTPDTTTPGTTPGGAAPATVPIPTQPTGPPADPAAPAPSTPPDTPTDPTTDPTTGPLTHEPPDDGTDDPDPGTTEPTDGTSTSTGSETDMANTMPTEINDHGTLEKVLNEKYHRISYGEDSVTRELEDLVRLPEVINQQNFGPKTTNAVQEQAGVARQILTQMQALMEQLAQARQQVIDAKGE